MNLRDWLYKVRLSVSYFAALINVNRSYVHMWMRGYKIPSQRIMSKIQEITINQVTEKEQLIDDKIRKKKKSKHLQS